MKIITGELPSVCGALLGNCGHSVSIISISSRIVSSPCATLPLGPGLRFNTFASKTASQKSISPPGSRQTRRGIMIEELSGIPLTLLAAVLASFCIAAGTKKMERDVTVVTNDPAVVRLGRDVKERSRSELPHSSILECGGCRSLKYQPEVLDAAQLRSDVRTDIDRPAPAGFINRPTDGHPADVDEL